jgi:hypothetical protein
MKLSLISLFIGLGLSGPAEAVACPLDVLGTSRVLEVGSKGGLQIGLKTYPQTLRLEDHEVVLTFDDGPNPGTTDRILDALTKQCVKATFFIIGRNAEANPALVKRAYEAGETIGHHTYSHPAKTLRLMSEPAAKADIDKGFAADDPHSLWHRGPGAAGAILPLPRLRRYAGPCHLAFGPQYRGLRRGFLGLRLARDLTRG